MATRIIIQKQLPMFENINQLSRLMSLSTRLLYCLSKLNKRYYKCKYIPKKDGSLRMIQSPSYTMSIVQTWILKNILDDLEPSERAMAFRKGKKYGIKTNARYHLETLYGLSIDLTDFFTNIKANKVNHLFTSLGYNSFASTILTNICTLNQSLPQGGICSPALSNLICISMDNRIIGLCEKNGIRYTRYADDMYFSCDNKDLLRKIYPIVNKIIISEGFEVNKKKTCFHSPSNKKIITGIVISQALKENKFELKAKRDLKREIRRKIHRTLITGDYSKRENILGSIAYVSYIEKENNEPYLDRIKNYIQKTIKNIVSFKELVEAYNQNKLIMDMPDIEYKPVEKDMQYLDEEEKMLLFDMFSSRKEYLNKNSEIDICSYDDWPEQIINQETDYIKNDDEEELPF